MRAVKHGLPSCVPANSHSNVVLRMPATREPGPNLERQNCNANFSTRENGHPLRRRAYPISRSARGSLLIGSWPASVTSI